jgi:hypothetical protein
VTSLMNQLFIPLDPELISRQTGIPSLRDLLARELSDEWCGVEPDKEEAPEHSVTYSLPRDMSPLVND